MQDGRATISSDNRATRPIVRFRSPIDWTVGAGRARASRPDGIDVIVPVHGAAAELRACLASVRQCTDLARHRVLVVLDGPQEEQELPSWVTVIRNERRLGFAGAVNRGIEASSRDVVLLNSDTIVTPRWIEQLIDAAYADGDVATVTPLSNDATLCSVPRPFETNLLPAGYDAASFAELIERVSTREYPRIPTAVGFCMYIRRAALEEVGFFDAVRFPRGYGEENDFCFRALARGWVHVQDDATFIQHAGHASFGESRFAAQREGRAALRRLHPRYDTTIAAFMKTDPTAAVRARIDAALGVKRERPRVVHLVQGFPPFQHGGTELYASWLVRQQQRTHHVAVYTRSDDPAKNEGEAVEWIDRGVRVRLVANHFTRRNPLRRNAIRDRALERDFARFLRQEQPDLVHIHHLAGHAFSLANVARRMRIPIVQSLHDWWFVCARVNQFDREGNRCSGPALEKCARCVTLTRVPPSPLTNRAMHVLRRRAADAALACADAFLCGSHAIRDDYAPLLPPGVPIHVLPYGIELAPSPVARERVTRPIRFGMVGAILPHKGVHLAAEAMRAFDPSEAVLVAWGNPNAAPEYAASLNGVQLRGTFREEEKASVFASMDVLLVPSIGLESFGIAAREAMACGVPVIAAAGGALSEMFEPGTCGDYFAPSDVEALRALLRRIVDDPAMLDRWRARLPVPKRSEDHAAEVARIYASVTR
ncbi:MAG TPA: glycosyltransferase [Thermoanaerobaculia bacterium]|nr:glycosyltransferase [Thermoanaerobaculia bacterium]